MKLFDVESPMMRFLGDAFDFFIIFLMTLILCIPIVTAGAALTAASYVSMKIMRKEAPAIFPSYFRAFKDNFKQATFLWIGQAFAIFLAGSGWFTVLLNGWRGVVLWYRIPLILFSLLVLFVNLTLYAVIARFRMSNKDIFKTAVYLALKYSYLLLLIVVLLVGTVFACYYYFRLLPLFFAVGFTSATALHGFIMMKLCKPIEAKMTGDGNGEENEEENEEENKELNEENREVNIKESIKENKEES